MEENRRSAEFVLTRKLPIVRKATKERPNSGPTMAPAKRQIVNRRNKSERQIVNQRGKSSIRWGSSNVYNGRQFVKCVQWSSIRQMCTTVVNFYGFFFIFIIFVKTDGERLYLMR